MRVAAMAFGLTLLLVVWAQASEALDVGTWAARFKEYDNASNGGRGNSDSASSDALGWGEAYVLHRYVMMYEAAKDAYWLDKIVDHVDCFLPLMDDFNGDGFLGWHTNRYSTALYRAEALHNRGTATITPEFHCEYDIEKAHRCTGHQYLIEFLGAGHYSVRDLSTWQLVAPGQQYESGADVVGLGTDAFEIEGAPEAGDKFRVETAAPEEIEYLVHDGMITYPIAMFIEIVKSDAGLSARYGNKADYYLQVMRKNIFDRWERYWLETGEGMGAYRGVEALTMRYPNRILPHNQYLALARTYLVLADVTGDAFYRDRAAKMAQNFKQYLAERDGAYVWYYWDWVENGKPDHTGFEDRSHATIDVDFVRQAAGRGVVFTPEDARRIARTYCDLMWNGSLEEPKIGADVSTRENGEPFLWGWAPLAEFDPQVWTIARAIFDKMGQGQQVTMAPEMLYTQEVLLGAAAR